MVLQFCYWMLNDRYRGDMFTVFNGQDKEFDNIRLPNLDSITVYGNPTSDSEVSRKEYVDDDLVKNATRRFDQRLQKYLKRPLETMAIIVQNTIENELQILHFLN